MTSLCLGSGLYGERQIRTNNQFVSVNIRWSSPVQTVSGGDRRAKAIRQKTVINPVCPITSHTHSKHTFRTHIQDKHSGHTHAWMHAHTRMYACTNASMHAHTYTLSMMALAHTQLFTHTLHTHPCLFGIGVCPLSLIYTYTPSQTKKYLLPTD